MSDPQNPPETPPPASTSFADPRLSAPSTETFPTYSSQASDAAGATIPYQPAGYEADPAYRPTVPAPSSYTPGAVQPPYAPPTHQMPASPYQQPGGFPPPVDPYEQGSQAAYPQTGYQQTGYQPGSYQQPGYQQSGYQPGYAYGQPPQPKKKRTGLVVGIIVAVIVLLGGCIVGLAMIGSAVTKTDAGSSRSGARAGAATSTPSAAAGDTVKDHSGDLRRFLLAPPSSSHPLAHPMSKTGAMTLEQDVAQSSHPSARRSFLETYNFDIEAVVEWHQADDTIVEVRLLRFDTVDDAQGYFDEDKSNFIDDYGAKTMTAVAGAPDAVTFADSKKDKYGYVSTAGLGVRGDVVIVTFTSQLPPLSVKVGDTLMLKEYRRL